MIIFFFPLYGQKCISWKDGKMALLGKNLYSSHGEAEETSFEVSKSLK